jgi:glycosyltransferase involved in cell wall biosynthesis
MEKKIKVVFVLRFKLHYRIDLYERINSLKDTDFTLLFGRGIKNTKFFNYEGKTGFKNTELKTWQYTGNGKSVNFFPSLFRHLVKLNPDVIVTEGESNMPNNILIYLYSFIYKKKVVWWSLGLVPGIKESFFQRMYKPIMKLFLRRSAYILGYSEYTKKYYSQYVNHNKIFVANNCLDNESIDKEIISYRSEASELKNSKEFMDKFVILYVGGFVRSKQVDKLIRAYNAVKINYPDIALVIVGEGVLHKELHSLVNKLGVQDIIFTGQIIKEVSKYFLLADLFVLPGVGGLSIHHAMIHSLPVISASADGTERDLIKENENGFILKTDTVQELTDYITKFLEDKTLAKRFGDKSREIVNTKINMRNMIGTFHNVITNCHKG